MLTACAGGSTRLDTVRICDINGCVERPHGAPLPDAAAGSADDAGGASMEALKILAESDARAAHDLGLRFFRGHGVDQDRQQALAWMRKAADMGDLQAQKALGRFYLTGVEETGADPGEAEKWLSLAAAGGDKASAKLLAEARAAKKSEMAHLRFANRWQPLVYRYWYSEYPYQGYWRAGAWEFD